MGQCSKARNAGRGGRAAVTQVDGGRWLTLEGEVRLATDTAAVDEGVRRYAARYRTPEPRPDRVVVEIVVDRVLGRCSVRLDFIHILFAPECIGSLIESIRTLDRKSNC